MFLVASVIVIANICMSLVPSVPVIQFDQTYAGTFRGKFLSSIKNVEYAKSEEFYKKWSLISYLDELVNEPIEESSFKNSIDPYSLLESYSAKNETFNYNSMSLIDRSRFYTNTILPNSNYNFKAIQDIIYKDAFYPKKFIGTRLKKWLKIKEHLTEEEQKILEVDDDWFRTAVTELKDRKLAHNQISATEIKNALSHLKFFSNIFLKPGTDLSILKSPDSSELINHCSIISDKLFPWLSKKYPKFTVYDKQLRANVFNVYQLSDELNGSCFIKSLQTNLEGKGLVVTANDRLVPELSGLLALLRITGNSHPIQIFHNNDLSLESIRILNDIATEPVMKLPESIPEFTVPRKLPSLTLIFVDVSNTIDVRYKKYFSGFGMKLLAYLFNSFEEMIMLDTDSVFVQEIDTFFNSPEYALNHAYFFRDRDVNSFLYEGLVDYFKSYLNYDNEVHYLGLPRVTDETLNNRFFGSLARHYMESGLFVINKKEKFDGVVTSVVLQMFKLFSSSTHGEKEFIWLGQEIMGNSYTFNTFPAIAIGSLSPDKGKISKELCTTHPAHLNADSELLWFNSGFLVCKVYESFYKDVNYERNEGKSLVQIKKEYLSPLHITHGLIPPPAEYAVKLNNGEPTRGWTMTQECSNYMWCAYDVIGGLDNPNIPKGKVISFEPQDTKKWDYLGRLWVNYFNKGNGNGFDDGYIEGDAYDELGLQDYDVFKGKNNKDNSEFEADTALSHFEKGTKSTDKKPATPGNVDGTKKQGDAKPLALDEEDASEDDVFTLEDEGSNISKEVKEDYDGY